MRIAIEGCTHGELEKTYETIKEIEEKDGRKVNPSPTKCISALLLCQLLLQSGLAQVDLLLCCGDFQSTRNLSDLACMACPDKYKEMCSFYKYYRCVHCTIKDGLLALTPMCP